MHNKSDAFNIFILTWCATNTALLMAPLETTWRALLRWQCPKPLRGNWPKRHHCHAGCAVKRCIKNGAVTTTSLLMHSTWGAVVHKVATANGFSLGQGLNQQCSMLLFFSSKFQNETRHHTINHRKNTFCLPTMFARQCGQRRA